MGENVLILLIKNTMDCRWTENRESLKSSQKWPQKMLGLYIPVPNKSGLYYILDPKMVYFFKETLLESYIWLLLIFTSNNTFQWNIVYTVPQSTLYK